MDQFLSILSQSPADQTERLAESILPKLGEVAVLQNRTGIAMLPYVDTAKGVTFHLGEVLMAEARIRATLNDGRLAEGYGACLGRNTRFALALAVLDAAWRAGIERDALEAFVKDQSVAQQARDAELMRKVETTRVEMETF